MHQYMTYFDCSLCWKSEALSPTVWSDTHSSHITASQQWL